MCRFIGVIVARILMLGMLLCLSGCGLITNGTTQKVLINTSNGKSVVATINGQKVQVPAELKISRKNGASIQVFNADNPRYEDSFFSIAGQDEMSVGAWLDILGIFLYILPGLISVGVDFAIGGAYQYSNTTWIIPVREKT